MAEIRATRDLFLWCISVIYLFAFTSLFVQIPGLYGDGGILPAKLVLEKEAESFHDLVARQPTLLRLLPRIGFDVQTGMDFLCLGGALLSFVAMVSRDQRNCVVFAVLWMFYLSLFQVGQTFLWFQWDVLLLEVGFLTILVAPLNFFGLHDAAWHHSYDHITFWLVRWLLFRLTFASGVVKLTSDSKPWWTLNVLQHYYETQCLPTPLAWYFHQLPDWLQRLSAVGVLVAQVAGALLFLSPVKNQRIFGFYCQVALMTLMTLTGNYGFYTLLTLTLCLSLVDDDWLNSWIGHSFTKSSVSGSSETSDYVARVLRYVFCVVTYGLLAYGVIRLFGIHITTGPPSIQSAVFKERDEACLCAAFSADDLNSFVYITIPLTACIGTASLICEIVTVTLRSYRNKKFNPSKRMTELAGCVLMGLASVGVFVLSLAPHTAIAKEGTSFLPETVHNVQIWTTDNYQLTNPYQFFRRTLEEEDGREEVIIEGTEDIYSGWKEYNFRFKPGNVSDRLSIVSPHQPRLDWQMWFAARGHYKQNSWLLNLVYRLLTNQKEVLELMGNNPFPVEPPKYIRASLYKYHFTSTSKEDKKYSDTSWWTRERLGDYLPVLSLDESSFINYLQQASIYDETTAEEKREEGQVHFIGRVLGRLRSLLGQGNGSSICLVLVVTGFLMTLLDPSIALFNAQPLIDGAATYISSK